MGALVHGSRRCPRGVGDSTCSPDTPLPQHDLPDRRSLTRSRPKPLRRCRSRQRPTHQPSCKDCNSEPPCGARAGASSGISTESPIARSTRSIESGSWIAASSRLAPPQRGHVRTSTPNTHSTQLRPRAVAPTPRDATYRDDAAPALPAAHVARRTPRQPPRRALPQYPCSHRRPLPLRQLPQPAARSEIACSHPVPAHRASTSCQHIGQHIVVCHQVLSRSRHLTRPAPHRARKGHRSPRTAALSQMAHCVCHHPREHHAGQRVRLIAPHLAPPPHSIRAAVARQHRRRTPHPHRNAGFVRG